jgi:two-component system response regulator HydG
MLASELDLRDILSFRPRGGVIRFMGRRAVLLDAVALGVLRKELVDTLGLYAARGVLTRLGYGHGWRVGEALKEEHPDLWAEGLSGPHLPGLAGQFVLDQSVRTDGLGSEPLVQTTWTESYEVEQHLLHFGRADEPVCWMVAGFASGYVSFKEGRDVCFVEDRCVARGDAQCRITGRFRERWGPEIEPHLAYYRLDSLDAALEQVSSHLRRAERRLRARRQELGILEDTSPLGTVARSAAMQRTLDQARRFAPTDAPILVSGESGVGKEQVARFIHAQSSRAGRPFVSLDCGAVPEALLEGELFGRARGTSAEASAAAAGVFEAATTGTLLLEEIGELSPRLQGKLLRAMQEKEICRVGESRPRPVDTRLVLATSRDLEAELHAGRFRRDLYYRLRVFSVVIQPLRERREDVLPLARLFLRKLGRAAGKAVDDLSPEAAERLLRYPWPGNVRELESVIEYGLAMCGDGDTLSLQDLPVELRQAPRARRGGETRALEEVEREHILAALQAAGGNKRLAAEALGIGLATLYRRLKRYGAGC